MTIPGEAEPRVTFGYDEAGRLTSVTGSAGTQRYRYDGGSQRIAAILDDRGEVALAIEYDDQGRVITERDADGLRDGGAVTFTYEPLLDGGVRTTVTYPPSLVEPGWHPVETTYHDARGRLTELEARPTSVDAYTGRYAHDADNRRIVLEDPCASLALVPRDWASSWLWRFLERLLWPAPPAATT